MKKVLTVGIAGGSGSGKSTITDILRKRFSNSVAVINHDDYYKAHHNLSYEERSKTNYDSPDAFDTSLMVEHLHKLQNFEAVDCPVYDYMIHDRSDKTRRIEPAEVLLIDGILVLAEPELRECMDIKLFVDTDADIRILRRIKRDVQQRKRTLDSVINQYLTTVKPMHEAYVEPSKKFADIIIPEGGYNLIAMEIVEQRILSHLKK
ncbi:MAG: uridine kinase [Clostridia bacterium]|nr:uridine kinase [Clostridia bacterium]